MADEKKVKRGEDYKVTLHPEVQAQIEQDADLAEFIKDMLARMRQALDGTSTDEERDAALSGAGFKRVSRDEIDAFLPTGFDDDEGDE